jgi:hypothetical protein
MTGNLEWLSLNEGFYPFMRRGIRNHAKKSAETQLSAA